jgi:hypothetical protein
MTTRCTRVMLAVAIALVVADCSQDSADLYAGEQTEDDMLPAEVDAVDYGWDADSSRLLATHEGTEFYVVAGEEGDCLITYDPAAAGDWVAGCTPGGRVGTSGRLGIKADFAPAGLPGETPKGWVRLTPQLQILTS